MNTETKKYYESLIWTNGVGNGTKTACVNSLAVLMDADRRGLSREQALGEFSDNSSCICPVIRRLSIRINDRSAYWPNKDEATAWMHATAPRLLDTKGSVKLTRKRAYLCADAAVREIATYYFDRLAERKPEFREWADKLRACDPVVDTRTSRAAQAVANEARKAADAYADAAAAAAAAVDAAAAFYAADADAYAAAAFYADAAAAAAAAVDAVDAYAAYADAANKHMILALLDRLIACKE